MQAWIRPFGFYFILYQNTSVTFPSVGKQSGQLLSPPIKKDLSIFMVDPGFLGPRIKFDSWILSKTGFITAWYRTGEPGDTSLIRAVFLCWPRHSSSLCELLPILCVISTHPSPAGCRDNAQLQGQNYFIALSMRNLYTWNVSLVREIPTHPSLKRKVFLLFK